MKKLAIGLLALVGVTGLTFAAPMSPVISLDVTEGGIIAPHARVLVELNTNEKIHRKVPYTVFCRVQQGTSTQNHRSRVTMRVSPTTFVSFDDLSVRRSHGSSDVGDTSHHSFRLPALKSTVIVERVIFDPSITNQGIHAEGLLFRNLDSDDTVQITSCRAIPST